MADNPLNIGLTHRGKQLNQNPGQPPLLRLSYTYPYNPAAIAMAYLGKYHHEPRTQLSTIAGVK